MLTAKELGELPTAAIPLRAWLAGQALPGAVRRLSGYEHPDSIDRRLAKIAVDTADAVLEALTKEY